MIHPVTIYSPKGKVRKVISSKVLTKKLYDDMESETLKGRQSRWAGHKPKEEIKKTVRVVICEYSQTEFQTTRPDTVYCPGLDLPISRRCHAKHYRERRRKPKIIKVCRLCREEFLDNKNKVFCRNPCTHELFRAAKGAGN